MNTKEGDDKLLELLRQLVSELHDINEKLDQQMTEQYRRQS